MRIPGEVLQTGADIDLNVSVHHNFTVPIKEESFAMQRQPQAVRIQGIHHFAYKCRDSAETRQLYEEVLGLPLVAVLEEKDRLTTTGDRLSFVHFFFQMGDGNYLAFFDFGDAKAPVLDAQTPKFANHLALRVENEAALMRAKARLEEFGVSVDGPLDHDFVRSIYFWDPNGIRLEYAYTLWDEEQLEAQRAAASGLLTGWANRLRQND